MLRREPSQAATVADWELGIAAVLLLVVLLLATVLVPFFA